MASPSQVIDSALDDSDLLGLTDILRPSGVGINCTKLEFVERLISEWTQWAQDRLLLEPNSQPPWLWVYPDGGQVYDVKSRTWSGGKLGTNQWAHQLVQIAKKASVHWPGVVLGGCCKTGPDHIRALKSMLDSRLGSVDSK